MPTNQFLSVQAFATRAGTSPQNIYQRVKTSLKPYTMTENGTIYINIKGLELFKREKDTFGLYNVYEDLKSILEEVKAETERLNGLEETFNHATIDHLNELNSKIYNLMELVTKLELNQNDIHDFIKSMKEHADTTTNLTISNLQTQIDFLKGQMDEKDRQISNRDRQIEAMTAMQAMNMKNKPEKIGFFKRLFS